MGVGVVVAIAHGKGPKVRWGPEEDDPEHHEGGDAQVAGDGTPSHQDGDGSCRPTDDDVLRGQPLQERRVNKHVEQGGRQRQHRREHVHREPQSQKGGGLEAGCEYDCGRRAHSARDKGAAGRPVHQSVDVAVEVHVCRVGAARRQGATDVSRQPRAATTMGGTVVTRSSSIMRGLVRATNAPMRASVVASERTGVERAEMVLALLTTWATLGAGRPAGQAGW